MDNLVFKIWENSDLELIQLELKEKDKELIFEEINSQLVFVKRNEVIIGTLELIENSYYYSKI